MNTTDLAPFLQPRSEPGPSMDVKYRQGTIVEFDPATLENQVDVGGTVMRNLPLIGVAEASSLVTGAVVGLLAVESTNGLTSYLIMARLVTPGTAAAAEAMSLLSSWVRADTIAAQEGYAVQAYGDLATIGPTVEVTVRTTGRVLVLITSQIQWVEAVPDGSGGTISVELAGANIRSPYTIEATLAVNTYIAFTAGPAMFFQGTYTASAVIEGLDPGVTRFRMKYLSWTLGKTVDFGRRSLVVITL